MKSIDDDMSLDIPHNLQIDMEYAAKYGNTNPMNYMLAMLYYPDIASEIYAKYGRYCDTHIPDGYLKSSRGRKDISSWEREMLIESSRRRTP